MKLIYEKSSAGRRGVQLPALKEDEMPRIDATLLRGKPAELPELSEVEIVRHFTALSRLNFSVDTHFYPLGSCTMKYNPKACHAAASLPEFLGRHPLAPVAHGQGFLACLHERSLLALDTQPYAYQPTPPPPPASTGSVRGWLFLTKE